MCYYWPCFIFSEALLQALLLGLNLFSISFFLSFTVVWRQMANVIDRKRRKRERECSSTSTNDYCVTRKKTYMSGTFVFLFGKGKSHIFPAWGVEAVQSLSLNLFHKSLKSRLIVGRLEHPVREVKQSSECQALHLYIVILRIWEILLRIKTPSESLLLHLRKVLPLTRVRVLNHRLQLKRSKILQYIRNQMSI